MKYSKTFSEVFDKVDKEQNWDYVAWMSDCIVIGASNDNLWNNKFSKEQAMLTELRIFNQMAEWYCFYDGNAYHYRLKTDSKGNQEYLGYHDDKQLIRSNLIKQKSRDQKERTVTIRNYYAADEIGQVSYIDHRIVSINI